MVSSRQTSAIASAIAPPVSTLRSLLRPRFFDDERAGTSSRRRPRADAARPRLEQDALVEVVHLVDVASRARGSWVTITTVLPNSCLQRAQQRRASSSAFRASRSPVGSSATMSSGSVTSARAIATRCCSPPESVRGEWSARSASPTTRSAVSARSRRSSFVRWVSSSGSSTFSSRGEHRDQVEELEHEARRGARGRPRARPRRGRSAARPRRRPRRRSAGRGRRGC